MTIIVTNAKSRTAYNIVKSLGQKDLNVITSDFVSLSMSFASRYSKGHFLYPSPFACEGEKFIESLIENICKYKANVLIPVFEETYLIAKFKKILSPYVAMVVPEYDQILLAHNKDRWETVARELHIDVPETFEPAEIRKDPRLLAALPYPMFIKPKQGGGGWGMSLIKSHEELESFLSRETYFDRSWDRFYLQRKIEGETHCVAMLFNKGQLRAKVAYKQIREYPFKNGQATFRISINTPLAESHLQEMLQYFDWHGVCQADYIVERESGIPYMVDLNPRFWGSLLQGIAAGVDFPYMYYRIAIDGDVEPSNGFKTGVMTRWIGGDLRAFFPFLKAASDKMEFIKQFFYPSAGKIYNDDFSFEDPLPFFAWYIDAISRAIKYRSVNPVSHDSLVGIWK